MRTSSLRSLRVRPSRSSTTTSGRSRCDLGRALSGVSADRRRPRSRPRPAAAASPAVHRPEVAEQHARASGRRGRGHGLQPPVRRRGSRQSDAASPSGSVHGRSGCPFGHHFARLLRLAPPDDEVDARRRGPRARPPTSPPVARARDEAVRRPAARDRWRSARRRRSTPSGPRSGSVTQASATGAPSASSTRPPMRCSSVILPGRAVRARRRASSSSRTSGPRSYIAPASHDSVTT